MLVSSDPYRVVAEIYDHLMKTISYNMWGQYLSSIKDNYAPESKSFLEIAAGTGKLSNYLDDVFSNLVLLDISYSMISLANKGLNRICSDMKLLPFKSKFDFIYSTFDSINYLENEEHLLAYFNEVKSVLSENGVFTFDASLENNSIKNVKRLNRKGKYKGKLFIQESTYDHKNNIHYNKFKVKLENGEIFEEVHSQKIFKFEKYFEMAENAGLKILACFEAFTFEDACDENERIQFIMKRINA